MEIEEIEAEAELRRELQAEFGEPRKPRARPDRYAPRLAFNPDPEFRSGLNVTVRHGRKWLDLFEKKGSRIVLLGADGRMIGKGNISSVTYLPFWQIGDPERYAELSARYADFSAESYVTVLYFTVDK
jgi:hypothetical protein